MQLLECSWLQRSLLKLMGVLLAAAPSAIQILQKEGAVKDFCALRSQAETGTFKKDGIVTGPGMQLLDCSWLQRSLLKLMGVLLAAAPSAIQILHKEGAVKDFCALRSQAETGTFKKDSIAPGPGVQLLKCSWLQRSLLKLMLLECSWLQHHLSAAFFTKREQ